MGVHVHCGCWLSCIITVNLSYSTTCKVKPMCTHTHNHALAPRCVGVTCIIQIQTVHRDWLAHTTAGGTQDLANIHSGCAITEDTAKATSAQSCTRNAHSANFNLHTKEKGTHLCIEFTAVYCHCSGRPCWKSHQVFHCHFILHHSCGSASSILATTAVTAVISVVSGRSSNAFAVELKISRTKTMVSFRLHSLT